MAKLVGGFCLPHDPLIVGVPDAAPADRARKVMSAFAEVRSRIEALNADTAIVIGDDHCTMFGPGCLPSILIGIGELEGPIEPWLNIPRRAVPGNPALAHHLMEFGFANGFDWAVARSLSLDHSTMVPIHLSVPASVRAIPIYISSGEVPLVSGKQCRELGAMLGKAVLAWPGDERVVILGTGGISHWVGMADMGRVNIEFDQRILNMVEARDIDGLASLTDAYIIEEAGNGALEIRNWIVALSALTSFEPRLLAYEPVPEWITGLGFFALEVAA
jgi:protocatechuate 4,5-dioxygenase beta chain